MYKDARLYLIMNERKGAIKEDKRGSNQWRIYRITYSHEPENILISKTRDISLLFIFIIYITLTTPNLDQLGLRTAYLGGP